MGTVRCQCRWVLGKRCVTFGTSGQALGEGKKRLVCLAAARSFVCASSSGLGRGCAGYQDKTLNFLYLDKASRTANSSNIAELLQLKSCKGAFRFFCSGLFSFGLFTSCPVHRACAFFPVSRGERGGRYVDPLATGT